MHILLIGALLAAAPPADEPRELEVLFIGNSYTENNELPWMVRAIARAEGLALRYEQVTSGGMSLEQHWANGKGEAVAKIASRKWDFVVLQEHSLRPIDEPAKLSQYAKLFDAKIKAKGARTMLYVTWPRKGAPENQAKLSKAFAAVAQELGATMVQVGPAWERALKERPGVALYEADESHPTPQATYFSALVFHHAIHGKPAKSPPKSVSLLGSVLVDFEATPTDFAFFQKIASETR